MLYYILREYLEGRLCRQNILRVTEVAQAVKNLKLRPGFGFFKLDVVDMYGTVRTDFAENLLCQFIDAIDAKGGSVLPKEIVKRMIRFSLRESCILEYANKVFLPMEGLPQGSPESGFVATVVFDYILTMYNEELFVSHRVIFWEKYMDDVLVYMPINQVPHFKRHLELLSNLTFEIEPAEEISGGNFY